ncbi:hypothetical protein [Bradyrhizobium viridifuturi]|uniref:hypothetical protein n=1 Tax=Bradyrhizobium viridifuturi TaxID=1654716 RepID=UPI00067F617E|nr:hypothetical protein [Bradyrhizobium viridifuturi]
MVQNVGVAPLTVGFCDDIIAGAGISLDGASQAGGQGGAMIWSKSWRHLKSVDDLFDGGAWYLAGFVPPGEIYAVSVSGSAIAFLEGVLAAP